MYVPFFDRFISSNTQHYRKTYWENIHLMDHSQNIVTKECHLKIPIASLFAILQSLSVRLNSHAGQFPDTLLPD